MLSDLVPAACLGGPSGGATGRPCRAGRGLVVWTMPASNGGSAVTGYNLYEGTKAGGESTKPVNSRPLAVTARRYVVSGLKKGTKYYFVVKAINALGVGKASAEVSATPS